MDQHIVPIVPDKATIGTADFAQLLELLLGDVDMIVGLKDKRHRYLFVNSGFEHLFPAQTGNVLGKTVADLADREFAKCIHAREDEVMRSGKPVRNLEQIKINGITYCWETIRFPYRNQQGQIIGTGFAALDVKPQEQLSGFVHNAYERAQKQIAELQHAVEEMQLRASTDALTGVWNRTRMEDFLQLEMARQDRYGHPVSIVLADLDYFKNVNDTWGHATGDAALKDFCDCTSRSLRSTDMLGRWGGEEFVLLLPNTGRSSAMFVAERVRDALASHEFLPIGRITASFGIATRQPEESLDDWIARADAAMYRAKQGGRNRIEIDIPANENHSAQPEVIAPGFIHLIWRTEFECGHPLIDAQHRTLFDYSNQLLSAILAAQPKEEITPLIDALLAEIKRHFEDEEAVIRSADFPQADEHHQIHDRLLAQGIALAKHFAEDRLNLGELLNFLVYEVVTRHMLADDRKFFPFISMAAP
ncbi:MAG: uncharacterized protein H6R04_466 [Burkholderiaceae bacterium]|nr:uncharacterized protein [Burkholderiaceae bacterium]